MEITRRSSIQTYCTFRLLADYDLTSLSMDGYGYFRWVDDQVDEVLATRNERLRFITRQKRIIDAAYAGKSPGTVEPEEQLIVDLIGTDRNRRGLLGSFIDNFIAIIEFDAGRNGRYITERELAWYSKTLSVAVIDCIQYFINHDYAYPKSADRYSAAVGAHITHMLRDYYEDIEEGFINIPSEYLKKHKITPKDTGSIAFRAWVTGQVHRARDELAKGMRYWEKLPVLRGKLAAYWYCVRFTAVLDTIERDGYMLREEYRRRKDVVSYLRVLLTAGRVIVRHVCLFVSPKP